MEQRALDPNRHLTCPNVTGGETLEQLLMFGFTREELQSKTILSVGAGFSGTCTLYGAHIHAIDPFMGRVGAPGPTSPIKHATNRCYRAHAEALPFPTGFFDVAFSYKAVGFYPNQLDLEYALREMLRVVIKDTGVVVFNWGQEMKPAFINHVLTLLHIEGYVTPVRGNVIFLYHPTCSLIVT